MIVRKKPIDVQAWNVIDLLYSACRDWKSLPKCIIEAYEKGDIVFLDTYISINAYGRKIIAESSEILIQDNSGVFYPCNRDVFQQTYEIIQK
jgi:hypothetical protein